MTNICFFCCGICRAEGRPAYEGDKVFAGQVGDKVICAECLAQMRGLVGTPAGKAEPEKVAKKG